MRTQFKCLLKYRSVWHEKVCFQPLPLWINKLGYYISAYIFLAFNKSLKQVEHRITLVCCWFVLMSFESLQVVVSWQVKVNMSSSALVLCCLNLTKLSHFNLRLLTLSLVVPFPFSGENVEHSLVTLKIFISVTYSFLISTFSTFCFHFLLLLYSCWKDLGQD